MKALLKRIAASFLAQSTLLFLAILTVLVVPLVYRSLHDSRDLMGASIRARLDAASQVGRLLLKVDDVDAVRNTIGYETPEYAGLVAALSTLRHSFAVDRAVLIRRVPGGGFVYLADARRSVGINQPVNPGRRFPGDAGTLAEAWARDQPSAASLVRQGDQSWFQAVTPLRKGPHTVALLVLERSTAAMDIDLAERRQDLLLGAVLALLGGAFLWGLLTWRGLRPLRSLRRAVQAVAEGDLSTTLPEPSGPWEIAGLARSVHALAGSLRMRLGEADARAGELEQQGDATSRDLRDVLELMSDGLLTVDAQGTIAGPCSAAVERLLGGLAAGADPWARLRAHGSPPQALREAFATLLAGPPSADWEQRLAALPQPLPTELRSPEGRRLGVRFAPVRDPAGERIEGVRVILSDRSDGLALQAALARCRGEQVSLVRVIPQREDFESFQHQSLALLDASEGQLQSMELVRRSVVDPVLRDLRTIESGAERFALATTEGLARRVEALLHNLGARRDEVWPRVERQRLFQAMSDLREALRRECAALQVRLGVPSPERQFTLGEARLQDIAADTLTAVPEAAREPLQAVLRRLRRVPAAALLEAFARLVEARAAALGKRVQLTRQADPRAELSAEQARALAPTLLQIVRNALEHGVERAEERRLAGKAAIATLACNAQVRDAGVVFTITDDGRGIDLQRIRNAAVAGGFVANGRAPALNREALMGLLFLPGFSAPGDPGARPGAGVGLDLVRTEMERQHGRVRLVTRRGHGTTVQLYCPVPD